MISSIDDLLLDDEEVRETVTPSRLDFKYFKRYTLAILISIILAALTLGANSLIDLDLFLAVSVILLPILLALESEVERKCAMYHFTNKRVVVERGIFNRRSYSIYYDNVTHLETKQAIHERIFDVSDLHLHAAGEQNEEIVLNGVKGAEKYRKMINKRS